jgi:hypothetical protein
MLCKTAWSREFWMDIFPKSFIGGEYKKHRENILFDKEKSLLPESQQNAELLRTRYNLEDQRTSLIKQVKQYEMDYQKYLQSDNIDPIHKKELARNIAIAKFEVSYIDTEISDISHKKTITKSKLFIHACPTPNCKGMLSTRWMCGLCGVKVCSECRDIIQSENHVCNPDTLATAKLISKECKSCPKCASVIYRISGCSQMWCTICHIAFDWLSGQILQTHNIHNPHLIEWMQTHPNIPLPGDDIHACGGVPSISYFRQKYSVCPQLYGLISHMIMGSNHNRDIVMTRYNHIYNLEDNDDLRVEYLLNNIDETAFKAALHKRDKMRAKKREIYQVIELGDIVMRDMIMRICDSYFDKRPPSQILYQLTKELEEFVPFINSQMIVIEKRYQNCVPRMGSTTFQWA